MNNGTMSNDIGLSPAELWIHAVVFYVILCGIVSTIGNVLICIGIVRSRLLRSRFFIIVWCLSLCRALLGVQYLIIGLYRIVREAGVAPLHLRRLTCHSLHVWLLVGLTLELTLLLLLVMERAMALISYNCYRGLNARQASLACLLATVAVFLLKLPPSYVDVDLDESIACVNSYSAPSLVYNLYTQNIDLSLLGLILLAYISLMVYVRMQNGDVGHHHHNGHHPSSELVLLARRRQLKLLALMRNLILAHSTFSLIPKVLRCLSGVYSDDPLVSMRLSAYGGLFTTIDQVVNTLLLSLANAEIRLAVYSSVTGCRIKTPVLPQDAVHRTSERQLDERGYDTYARAVF